MEETDSTGQFRVPRRGRVRRREEYVEEYRSERTRKNGKVMSTCVTRACMYGTETLALTGIQQQRLKVCENNRVLKIVRVTSTDRRRMVELMEETGEEQITVGWTCRKDG